uniref:Trehalose synthase n=1 Tax=Nitratidesulfovibrio vulgaris (strain DSM 19637 / Miyazaki F) TaxID=883 RepID=B8DJH3_NITV9
MPNRAALRTIALMLRSLPAIRPQSGLPRAAAAPSRSAIQPAAPVPGMVLHLVLSLALGLLLTGCGAPPAKQKSLLLPQGPSVTRADPGYMQWLEKQSLLGAGAELSRVVSGSQLGWRSPSLPPDPDNLLRAADTWLLVHPMALIADGTPSAFAILAQPRTQELLRRTGARGLYVAPSGGAGAIWAYDRSATLTGDDTIQHGFSEAAGTDDEYLRLRRLTDNNRMLLGTDIIPAATGMGPDFFLAARNVREYPGAYCLVEIPRDLWPYMPASSSEWQARPLTRAQHDLLAEKGLLPASLSRDLLSWARPGGWAVTGEVRGSDGTLRRWVYRHAGRYDMPVLHWDDPSAAARRILSSSIIQQIGLRGMALTGFRVEPLTGLDPLPRTAYGDQGHAPALEPAPTAALSLARETRRYGGWAWQRDRLPLPLLARTLHESADVAEDTVTSPAAEHALLTGDARPLRALLDDALRLGIDMRRLVHATPGPDGVDYALPQLSPGMLPPGAAAGDAALADDMRAAMRTRAALWASTMPLGGAGDVLPVTGAGLAALGAGFSHADAARADARETIRQGHLALVFFKAMQPGLLVLHGQDLAGALPLDWHVMADSEDRWDPALAPRGAYALYRTARTTVLTKQGMPRAPVAYPTPDEQLHDPHSFLNGVHAITAMRERTGIAAGRVAARLRTQGRGCIALAVELPGGRGVVVAVTNFGREAVTERLDMAATPKLLELFGAGNPAVDLEEGTPLPLDGGRMVLHLNPWETRAILVGRDAKSIGAATAAEQPKGPFVPARDATPMPVVAPPAPAKSAVAPPAPAPVPDLTIRIAPPAGAEASPVPAAPEGMPAETPATSGDAAAMPGVPPTVAPAAAPEAQPATPPMEPTPTEQVPLPPATEPVRIDSLGLEPVGGEPAPSVPVAPTPAQMQESQPVPPAVPPSLPHDAGGEVRAPVTPPEIPALPEPVAPPAYPATPEVTAPATESTAPPLLTPTAPADGTDGGLVPYKSARRTAPETLDGPIVPIPPASTALPGGTDVPTDGTTTYKAPLRRAPETLDAPITVPPLPTPPAPPAEPVTPPNPASTESGTAAP